MKTQLIELLASCLKESSEADEKAITFILEGLKRKLAEKNTTYIDELLHMEKRVDDHTCEITIPNNPVFDNSLNIVHGGITATLLDTTMGTLANNQLSPGYGAVTNQLNIHYIAPGIGESLRCRSEIVHQGSKTMVISGEVFRSDGKKIAYATGTFFIIKK